MGGKFAEEGKVVVCRVASEAALNLTSMKIHCQDTVDSTLVEELSDGSGGKRTTERGLSILTSIRIEGANQSNTSGTAELSAANQEEHFEQAGVDVDSGGRVGSSRLDDVDITASDVQGNFAVDFPTGLCVGGTVGDGDVEEV